MGQYKQKEETKKSGVLWKYIFPGATLVATVVLCGYLGTTQLVPFYFLVMLLAGAFLLSGSVLLLCRMSSRAGQGVGAILAVGVMAVSLLAGLYLWRTVHTIKSVSGSSVERTQITLYVLKESPLQNPEDLTGKTVGILGTLDRANSATILERLETEEQISLSVSEYDSLTELADALQQGETDAVLLNEAYLALYEEISGYEEFVASLRAIQTQQIEHEVTTEQGLPTDPVINILISGSDTRGDLVDQRGRSDVNIIASINTQTHQILLVSTPRDYFVPLDVGVENAYDKLTHAGIYGMDVLRGTLENLYGIEIDYYFRLNFVGFVRVIDALGGVDVYSDYAFDSGEYHYQQGTNALDGEAALAFVRNRYAFAEGDRQRGKNQMAVVEAVMQKATSPAVLGNYLSILQSVQSCVDTNVPYDVLSALVRQQLQEGAIWTVESCSVNGSDAHSTTYSMNQDLYVMIPDEETVQEAKEKLAAIGNSIA